MNELEFYLRSTGASIKEKYEETMKKKHAFFEFSQNKF